MGVLPYGFLWVVRVTADEADEDRGIDIFDPVGRYLGEIRLPFAVSMSPAPIVRDGVLYAVTEDEFEVPYLVRARIQRPDVNWPIPLQLSRCATTN